MFRVFTTTQFDEDLEDLDNSEQIRVRKIRDQLREKGKDVGKPLSGVDIFREKKFDGKRLFFLVYERFSVVLLLAIGNKKTQQATINKILSDVADYEIYVIETIKKQGL